MGADIFVGGKRIDEVASFSATEFATSLDPSDMSGGAGQITAVLRHSDATAFSRRKEVKIVDEAQGTTIGSLAATSVANDFAATITADSRLVALTYTRTALPYTGTLGGLLRYYFGLVGLTANITIDMDIDSRPATALGWYGPVLDAVKRICSAEQIELSLVAEGVVVRKVRERIANNARDATVTLGIDDTSLAEAVEVFYMHSISYEPNALVYPAGGWSEDNRVISVKSGEVEEVEFDLIPKSGETGFGASLESVVQPVCQDFVGREVDNASVYCIMGNDDKPIPAARWLAMGGNLEVEIAEDTRSIIVRVTGSSEEELSPFRVAATAGDGHNYSSLRIMGEAVVFDKRSIRAETGISKDLASQEIVQVESDFIVGIDAAWKALFAAFNTWSSPRITISVNTRGINRQKDTGLAAYPLIGDFNEIYAGQTIGDFNAEWAGKTIADFNEFMFDQVRLTFENQAFGNIAGARVPGDGMWFRIIEATVTHNGITYTALADTTIGDWNEHYDGMTIGDFNALADGMTLGDLTTKPLLKL